MYIMSFIIGCVVGIIGFIPYFKQTVAKHKVKSYAEGYLVGVGLKDKADKMLKEGGG